MKKKPRAGPRQGAWHTFHKHWLATGVASMAKGGRPRLHLLAAAPPVSHAAPGSTHIRVGAALTPAKGKRPTASAWALEAHDVGPDEYSALIPLLQRQVLCVDTTASTPSTLR